MSAKLDIIVMGATGYTGTLTCAYLNTVRDEPVKWGIAGRSRDRLDALKKAHNLGDVPVFVVDINDAASLDAMCSKATCVLSCAGPFTNVGMPVVEACMRNKTHYVDSTGEFPFVRRVAERFHDEASKAGVALVSCCGFDCVPSDMGNYVVHRKASEPLKSVKCFVDASPAGVSSGTVHSVAEVFKQMERADMSPVCLNPAGAPKPVAASTHIGFWFDWTEWRFTAPYFMATANERIVRRTNALMNSTASYIEATSAGFFNAITATVAYYIGGFLLAIPPLRNWLCSRFPAESGPSAEKKKAAYYKMTFVGTTVSGKRITTVLKRDADMYDDTAIFLSQSALSCVTLAKKGTLRGGVLTTMSAFQDEMVRRCLSAGVQLVTTTEGEEESKKEL